MLNIFLKLVFMFFVAVKVVAAEPDLLVKSKNQETGVIESYNLIEQEEQAQLLLNKYPRLRAAVGYVAQETVHNKDFLNAIKYIEAKVRENGDRVENVSVNVRLFPDNTMSDILANVDKENRHVDKEKMTAHLITELNILVVNAKKQTSRNVAVVPGLQTELSELGTFAYMSYLSPDEPDVSNLWSVNVWEIAKSYFTGLYLASLPFRSLTGCGSKDNGGSIENLDPNPDSGSGAPDPNTTDPSTIFTYMPGTMNKDKQVFCVCKNPRTLEVTPANNAKAGDQYHIYSVGPIKTLKDATEKLKVEILNGPKQKVYILRGIAIEPRRTVVAEFSAGPHQLYAFTRRQGYPDTAAYGPVKMLITEDNR